MDLEPFIHLISFSGWLLLGKGSFLRYRCNGTGHQIMAANQISHTQGKAQLAAVSSSPSWRGFSPISHVEKCTTLASYSLTQPEQQEGQTWALVMPTALLQLTLALSHLLHRSGHISFWTMISILSDKKDTSRQKWIQTWKWLRLPLPNALDS